MSYKGRAFYNLLQMNLKRNPQLEVEKWQVENYHNISTEELFSRLESHQIFLDQEHFTLYVDESDSPEDLTDMLYFEKDFTVHEQIFLCIFELWRKLCPHKQSLSLFVDELDHHIEHYEQGIIKYEDDLQAGLLSLQKILDDNVDEGGDAEEGFSLLSQFSCHDIEVFIYEYISHQLDLENDLYSSELLEGFYPYMKNIRWFEFLRIRVISAANFSEGPIMIERLLESLKENLDIHLLFEMLHFLVCLGENTQFISAFDFALESLQTEEDLCELLNILRDYFNCSDKEREEQIIVNLIEQRKNISPSTPLHADDDFFQIIKNSLTYSLT